jgi:hypothetical protein
MPKKPRYGRALQKKKRKVRQPAVSAPVASPVMAQENIPIVSTPPPSAPVAKTKAPAVKYPYVTAELRRIGILAGAILVILIVLALVL